MDAQTVALLNLAGPDGAKAGLVLGTVTSAGLIALYLKRALDTGMPCRLAAVYARAAYTDHISLQSPCCRSNQLTRPA